jgi:predicted RNase H-like HicB family nuclease
MDGAVRLFWVNTRRLGYTQSESGFAMYVLTEYLDQAMAQAVYDKLDDGTYGGRIPPCPGVVAFATSLTECAGDLRSTLEDWVLLGIKLAHVLPVIADIDLNREPIHEPVDTL